MAKQAKNEGVLDRISTLPDHILCHMLCFLPIKDAVRTSVLSPRWRYLFTFMSTLDLYDYRQFRGFTRRDFNDFKNFVDRLLLFPKQQVRLECFRVTENASDGDCPRLYGWICAVLSRGIKELVVSYGKTLRLPTLLFTCQSLVTLELDIPGDMKIPPDVSLPNLKSLNLSNFLFSDGLIFKLVSSCHVLEELYMEFVKLGRNITEVNIHNLSLKRMTLEFVLVNRDKDYKMVINAPNLEYFKIYDMLADGYRVSSMNSLEHANIKVHQCPEYAIYDVNRERAATNLLQAICNVKCLYLLITHAETLIPMGPEPVFAFHKLVQLKFVNETEAWVGTWILEFLHCVPNLEILHLALDAASEGIKPLAENVPSCVSFHLTEIRISRFVGDEPMFQMISFFLNNRGRNISAVGAFSRTVSVPSVSGPAFQVCRYHIDCALVDSSQIAPPVSKCQSSPMAVSSCGVVIGGFVDSLKLKHGHLSSSASSADIFYGNRSIHPRISLKSLEKPNNYAIYGQFLHGIGKRWCNCNLSSGSGSRAFHGSLPSCLSAGTARDVSFDNSGGEEQVPSSEEKISAGKTLKLLSGSCYLPHPDKEDTGGEDAHFICADEQAIGLADGVGGWADLGIDAGQFSRELMSKSVSAIQEEPKGSINPARVLEKAHSSTKAKGSSTACVIALGDQGLHAINLGDSGFMVVRDGCTIFRSPVQQHDFNFTYQLESGNNADLPSSGQIFAVPVAPGDVIIAGTDGLFDNLYNNEITAVVVHALRAGFGPEVTAQKIAALARERAQARDRQTPFSTAAQDAGFRYYGGKLDDITVVVSYVTSSDEASSKKS